MKIKILSCAFSILREGQGVRISHGFQRLVGFSRPPGNDQIFKDGSIAMHLQLVALVLVAEPVYVGLDGVTRELLCRIGLESIYHNKYYGDSFKKKQDRLYNA